MSVYACHCGVQLTEMVLQDSNKYVCMYVCQFRDEPLNFYILVVLRTTTHFPPQGQSNAGNGKTKRSGANECFVQESKNQNMGLFVDVSQGGVFSN